MTSKLCHLGDFPPQNVNKNTWWFYQWLSLSAWTPSTPAVHANICWVMGSPILSSTTSPLLKNICHLFFVFLGGMLVIQNMNVNVFFFCLFQPKEPKITGNFRHFETDRKKPHTCWQVHMAIFFTWWLTKCVLGVKGYYPPEAWFITKAVLFLWS